MPTPTPTSCLKPPISLITLSPATPARPGDAARIAEIHMAAFGPNAMLRAQFPNETQTTSGGGEGGGGLRESVRLKALADIRDPRVSVLVVRCYPNPGIEGDCWGEEEEEEDEGLVVAFAKWSLPANENDGYREAEWIWPPGTNMDVLNAWSSVTEEAERRLMRDCDGGFYRLTFMGTDPAFERRGAATKLVQWGLDRCRRDGVPAYLEGTLNAAAFYEKKMGFKPLERISLRWPNRRGLSGDGATAIANDDGGNNEGDGDGDGEWVYEEIVFRYDPPKIN
ncbi:putative GNAT family acetyltransferase [Xylariaceae sp. FL0594]|nr:putative GNAT family acetyltransferase [Xylariaceae sp. FL0594]